MRVLIIVISVNWLCVEEVFRSKVEPTNRPYGETICALEYLGWFSLDLIHSCISPKNLTLGSLTAKEDMTYDGSVMCSRFGFIRAAKILPERSQTWKKI